MTAIIECDEIDIAKMCEAEQTAFYASLLTRIIDSLKRIIDFQWIM